MGLQAAINKTKHLVCTDTLPCWSTSIRQAKQRQWWPIPQESIGKKG